MDTDPLSPQAADSNARLGAALQIRFDGRYYHYRSYRYERLDDAVNYARRDQARPSYRPDPQFAADWQPPYAPTAEEAQLMAQHGIGFAAARFSAGGYAYDHLADALAQVRLRQQRREAV